MSWNNAFFHCTLPARNIKSTKRSGPYGGVLSPPQPFLGSSSNASLVGEKRCVTSPKTAA